jgi:hypothetical protein
VSPPLLATEWSRECPAEQPELVLWRVRAPSMCNGVKCNVVVLNESLSTAAIPNRQLSNFRLAWHGSSTWDHGREYKHLETNCEKSWIWSRTNYYCAAVEGLWAGHSDGDWIKITLILLMMGVMHVGPAQKAVQFNFPYIVLPLGSSPLFCPLILLPSH